MLFLSIILIIGSTMGILIAIKTKTSFIPILNQYQEKINGLTWLNLITHFTILTFLLITSIVLIGIPFYFIVLFIEGINIGFLATIFFLIFKIKGFIFSIFFIIFTNFFIIAFLFLLFPKCLEISRNIISHFLYKKDNEIVILKYIMSSLIFIFISLIGDLLFLLISPKVLNILSFLLR